MHVATTSMCCIVASSVTVCHSVSLYSVQLYNHICIPHIGIESLLEVRSVLNVMQTDWNDLGLALKVGQPTLDAIATRNRGDVGQCLTDTLAEWLQSAASPNWRSLVEALLSPTVNHHRLAREIAESRRKDSSVLQEPAHTNATSAENAIQLDDIIVELGKLIRVQRSKCIEGWKV